MEYTYEIGGKTYVQRPLVLGQLRQLLAFLKGVAIPRNPAVSDLVEAFGDGLSEALAIVLTEQGKSLKDKDIEALAEEIAFTITPDVALGVVDDFLACNPVVSLLERLAGMAEKIKTEMTKIGLENLSSSSAPEI